MRQYQGRRQTPRGKSGASGKVPPGKKMRRSRRIRTRLLVGLLVLLLLPLLLAPARVAAVRAAFSANASAPAQPFTSPRVLSASVGSGHAPLSLRASTTKQPTFCPKS